LIYAATKPIEEYDVHTAEGFTSGLYKNYGGEPALLALIMIGSPLPYDYEGDKPEMERQVVFTNLEPMRHTLKTLLMGELIEDLLCTSTPMEFYELLMAAPEDEIAGLPIVKNYYAGNVALFRSLVGARAAAWALDYKGKVATKGNMTQVNFGKPTVAVPEHLAKFHQALKGRI